MAAPHICPNCGTANDTRATFCGACAAQLRSTSTALVPVSKKPAALALSTRDKATLGGVALGLATLALRVGAALLQQVSEQQAQPATPAEGRDPAPSTIRVRRRWVVGDRYGPQRWGEEEIEIDRPEGDSTSYRISWGRRR